MNELEQIQHLCDKTLNTFDSALAIYKLFTMNNKFTVHEETKDFEFYFEIKRRENEDNNTKKATKSK